MHDPFSLREQLRKFANTPDTDSWHTNLLVLVNDGVCSQAYLVLGYCMKALLSCTCIYHSDVSINLMSPSFRCFHHSDVMVDTEQMLILGEEQTHQNDSPVKLVDSHGKGLDRLDVKMICWLIQQENVRLPPCKLRKGKARLLTTTQCLDRPSGEIST